MANRAKKHHYNPKFYLAGFTRSGTQNEPLYVFDQQQIRQWQSTPANSGCENGFYDVDLGTDVDPAIFESQVLARLDGEFARVIRTTVENEALPEGDDFDVLLNFVAVMATRTPRIRRLVGGVTDPVVQSPVKALVSTDDGWQRFLDLCPDLSNEFNDAELQDYRAAILNDEFTVDLNRTSHVQKILELSTAMLPLLAQREWAMGIAPPGMPDFVCSDAPVSAVPPPENGEWGLRNPEKQVILPLTRRVVLLGSHEQRTPAFQMNELDVLWVNGLTIMEARQVFSMEQEFAYLGSDKKRKSMADLKQSLRQRGGTYSQLDEAVTHWFHARSTPPDE